MILPTTSVPSFSFFLERYTIDDAAYFSPEPPPISLVGNIEPTTSYVWFVITIGTFALPSFKVNTLNAALSYEKIINIKPGETYKGDAYEFFLIDFDLINESNYDSVQAKFSVKPIDSPKEVFFMFPEKRKYFIRGQITSESAIKITPLKDIYMTLGDQLDNGYWVVNIQYNFLIRWIWIAAAIMCFGGFTALIERLRKS